MKGKLTMSDHIGHLGICDDTFRLATCHDAIHPTFKRLMAEHRDVAHMGAVTRSADRWSVRLVHELRDRVDEPGEPRAAQKLAFVLGALTHRAADRLTKPITRCWPGDDDAGVAGGDANESKIMQDLFVFKEVYHSGRGDLAEPLGPTLLDVPASEARAALEAHFRVLLRRALIAMHTIKPDPENIDQWLDAFLDALQGYPKRLNQYAELAAAWDVAKVKKYLIDKHFYSRQDPLIVLARSIQRGSTPPPGSVEQAVRETDKQHSRYARALAKAIAYLLAAGELFEGRIDLEQAKQRFDIGVPELSLQE